MPFICSKYHREIILKQYSSIALDIHLLNKKYQLHETYYAERSVKSLYKSYIIRAEYKIAESKDLQKMELATLISLFASIIIKVLLLDDDVILGNAIAKELIERGYEVMFFNSIYGVDDAIRDLSPDVLVLDVEIGKNNVIALAYDLYDGNPSLPVIFISSHHDEKFKEEGLLFAGAVAYLDKPFSVKLLAAHIDRFTCERIGVSSTYNKHDKKIGNAIFDLRNKALLMEDGNIKELCSMEFNILKKLVSHFANYVSREDVLYAAWEGQSEFYNDQSLNNYIRRLRVILEESTNLEINSSRGLGHQLKERTWASHCLPYSTQSGY